MSTVYRVQCDDCGRRFMNEHRGRAEYSLRRHSCERTHVLRERRKRVAERKAYEGEKRECFHKQADHQHGTRTAYVLDKCRCRPCIDASSAAERRRQKLKAFGRYDAGRVDAGPVREHILMLAEHGLGLKRVAKLAGVSNSTLGNVVYGRTERGEGPQKRLERRTAEAILAVKPGVEIAACGARVDATGTHRRLQALVAIGYSISSLGRRLGILVSNMDGPMGASAEVTAATARKVRELYDELWNQPYHPDEWKLKVAASRARNLAKARGWAPPMAWDDDAIDDPTARPEGIVTSNRTRMRREDIAEDVHDLLRAGCGAADIAERIGMAASDVARILDRAGRHDLARWLRTGCEESKEAG